MIVKLPRCLFILLVQCGQEQPAAREGGIHSEGAGLAQGREGKGPPCGTQQGCPPAGRWPFNLPAHPECGPCLKQEGYGPWAPLQLQFGFRAL